ncbi:hypothetical protein HPP92_021487 [Vanilla planifolia]|uniref:Uncharacterized protein n=1 Tax=Vanilla planifolia TaxID=51239 RepID=A0A835PYY0_VANPL|nr:hypothetical protein HPP92_021487 [Vanilla planifolia]
MNAGSSPCYFLCILCFLPFFLKANSVDLPVHGCYWTESCQSKWFGGCDAVYMLTDQSDDCNGLCAGPSSRPCLPFHTHFHCCKPEIPKATFKCARCRRKLDFGDSYVCCTDCSSPNLVDKTRKLGYCKTGVELAIQVKQEETFTWVAGPWMKCSSPCDGGVRYRDVGCFGTSEGASSEQYPVDDRKCLASEMPLREETCNLQSCGNLSMVDLPDNKHNGMSGWVIMLLALGLLAAGGLGFAGYTYYGRTASTHRGFVYIMMEGYS